MKLDKELGECSECHDGWTEPGDAFPCFDCAKCEDCCMCPDIATRVYSKGLGPDEPEYQKHWTRKEKDRAMEADFNDVKRPDSQSIDVIANGNLRAGQLVYPSMVTGVTPEALKEIESKERKSWWQRIKSALF